MTEFLIEKDPIIIIVDRIRKGEFTKDELRLREHEKISIGMTVGELIEGSFNMGDVQWNGETLQLTRKAANEFIFLQKLLQFSF